MSFRLILSYILATFIISTASAQQKNDPYESAWKNVDTLIIKKGLPASALTEVNKIYQRAKSENNSAQQVKALWYRLNLQQTQEEHAEQKSIADLEKEITQSNEPVRSILQSLEAQAYLSLYNSIRYRLYSRTPTAGFKQDDIETWSVNDFHAKISALYLASVSNEKILQQVKLDAFKPIIIKGNVSHLRPALFDILAHRALEYFMTGESRMNKPAVIFEIDDPIAFADASAFAGHRFNTADSLSLEHKALQLYQRLIQFHLNDPSPDALIDIDLDRLQYVKTKAIIENKDDLYKQALQHIIDRYGLIPAATQASWLLAQYYSQKASQYQPLQGDSNRYDYVKAKAICEKVLARPETSEGKTNCLSLSKEIEYQEFSLTTEKINVPGLPFRVLVSYRNFTKAYFRIVKVDQATSKYLQENNDGDSYWQKLVQVSPIRSFSQSLPDTKDYQKHTVEIKMDSLPPGEYFILASVREDFSLDKNPMALQSFYVSNISWINKDLEYVVLHRETGQPIAAANVQIYYRNYDYNTRKYTERKGENIMTDKNGYFKIFPAKTVNESTYRVDISMPGDHLSTDNYTTSYYRPTSTTPQKETIRTFLFTDRSIYRPGQTLYFKGISIKKDPQSKENTIAIGRKDKLYLRDVNGQRIDSLELTTNEYGSYSGKFKLPASGLNGQFTISNNTRDAYQYFRVEEYKRPKFQVEISKPNGTYRLNDSIKVIGNAKAYAGNNIDGASVTYRVVRRAIIPVWYYGYYKIWPPFRGESVEISHGQTTTDINGKFTIPFKANPDKSIPKNAQPVFYYEVSADITDISGETRSGTTSVSVAYQALKLDINIPDKKQVDSLQKINLSSANINGIFEKATATVALYKLKMSGKMFRTRYWEQADQYVMTQEEYYKYFPYDLYKNELETSTWPREEKAAEVTDTTSASGVFNFPHSKLAPGWYVMEATTKDKYGEEVKDIKYIQLFETSLVTPYMYGMIDAKQPIAEPGQKQEYSINTNLDSVYIIRELVRKYDQQERTFFRLDKKQGQFDIPFAETDRGGLGVQIAFVKHNRIFTDAYSFSIPYYNKELTITYETFRDKTLPGSEEKWKVKIKGYKGEKAAAEVLAGMYDASLDQFNPHSWRTPSIYDYFSMAASWSGTINFTDAGSSNRLYYDASPTFSKEYDYLGLPITKTTGYISWPGYSNMLMSDNIIRIRGNASFQRDANPDIREQDGAFELNAQAAKPSAAPVTALMKKLPSVHADADGVIDKFDEASSANGPAAVQIRKNFNETAFFFPELSTDSNGAVEFSFTMPEALTQWKWMTLAHTKDLAFGYNEKTIITQKELMVQPNAPRFLREGDRMDFSGKIVNISDKEITGQVQLLLIDPTNNQSVDGWFRNMFPNQYFTVAAGQSVPVSFTIEIPFQYNKPVTYRIVASSTTLSDGEENVLPVISNRMLVTESMPLPMRGNTSKVFKFEKLLNSGKSESLSQHALTVEFTSNPAWYAVQALPYLMEYPYECAEQTFNRYYANTLASAIVAASPKIKEVFERWKNVDTAALLSKLQKNEELKSVLLQETPWVLQGKSESQQKKNIALLFDLVRMEQQQATALNKLKEMQSSNGGFVWFKGGPDDRYMTQYILTGIGHLKKLNALPKNNAILNQIIGAAIPYLDQRIKEDYEALLKIYKNKLPEKVGLDGLQIQYLYMRSFFPETGISGDLLKAYTYYRKQSQQVWLQQSKYYQGMIALSLFRTGDVQAAKNIVASLKQNAIVNEELGMYWKDISSGYYWYQAPIETQSLLIETFTEVTNDTKSADDMKTWLLKQKQTQNWKTTRATADACYALLLQGSAWLSETPEVSIKLGDYTVSSTQQKKEAGTGYFKKVIDGKEVKPSMGDIQVFIKSQDAQTSGRPAWGAVYWQYFEDLDKITPSATPLQLSKKLFVEKLTDRGPVLQPVNEGDELKIGDKIKVRIVLKSDRAMEYVHMKDMRAACMEPVNVLSQYKYQGGLGYYETTKDASTSFFFGWLPKGTFVFEYPMFVTHSGTFSNGVTSIECMYAPEFTSHSEGVKVNVAN